MLVSRETEIHFRKGENIQVARESSKISSPEHESDKMAHILFGYFSFIFVTNKVSSCH
jgi:hypothetical protein